MAKRLIYVKDPLTVPQLEAEILRKTEEAERLLKVFKNNRSDLLKNQSNFDAITIDRKVTELTQTQAAINKIAAKIKRLKIQLDAKKDSNRPLAF